MRKIEKISIFLLLSVLCIFVSSCDKHEHTYADSWSHDETNHWHAATCEHTDEKKNSAAHTYDQKVVKNDYLCTAATEKAAATYYYSCVCGVKGTETFSDGNPLHKHTYADSWSHDETNHWHAATCEHTDEKKDSAAHVYDQKVTTSDYLCAVATEEAAATYYYSCVCGVKGTENFSNGEALPHTHKYDQKVTTSDYLCAAATEEAAATYYYSCVCGVKGTETFSNGEALPHEHTYADSWTYDETNHWHAATCEHENEKKDTAAHVYDQKVVKETYLCTAATESTAATYYYSCVCGAKGTETFSDTIGYLVRCIASYDWISPTARLDLVNRQYIVEEKTSDIVLTNATGSKDTLVIECTIDDVAYTLSMQNGALVLKKAEETVDTFYVSAPEFNGAWLGPNNPNYYIISTEFNEKGYFDYLWVETSTGDVISNYDDYYLTKLVFDESGKSHVELYSDYDCTYYFNEDDVLVSKAFWGDDLMTPFTQEMAGTMVGENGEYISYNYENMSVSYSDRTTELVEGIVPTETHTAFGSGITFTVGDKLYQLVDRISYIELINLKELTSTLLCGYSPDFLVDSWANGDLSKTFTMNDNGEMVIDNVAYKVIPYCLDGELHYTLDADFVFDISLIITEYGLELSAINVTTENEKKEKVTEQYYYLEVLQEFIGSYDNYVDNITIDENYNISVYGLEPDKGSFCYNEDLASVVYQYNNMLLAFLDTNVLAIFFTDETQQLEFYGSVFNTKVLPEILESFMVGLDSETDIYTTGGINPHTITKIDTEKHTIVYDDVEYGILIDYNITGYSPYPELYLYELQSKENLIQYVVRTFDKGLELKIPGTEKSTYQYFISKEFYEKNVLNIQYAYKGQYYNEQFKIDEMGQFHLDTTNYENETGLISPIIYEYGLDRYIDETHGESFVIMADVGTINLYVYVYLEENTGMIMGMEYSNMTILNYIGDYYLDEQKISLSATGSVSIDGVEQTVVSTNVVDNGISIQIQKDSTTEDLLFTENTLTYQEKTYQKIEFTPLAFVGDYTFGEDKIEITSKCLSVNIVPELSVSINGVPAMYEVKMVGGNQCLVLNSSTFNYDIHLINSQVVFQFKDGSSSEGFDANKYFYSDFAVEDTILTDSNNDVHIVKTYAKEQLGVLGVTYDGEACNNYQVFVNDDGHYVLEVTSGTSSIWLTITETGVTVGYKVSSIPTPPPLPPAPPLPPIL